jgi:hypothetical protein
MLEGPSCEPADLTARRAVIGKHRLPSVQWSSTSDTRTSRVSGRPAGTARGSPAMPPSPHWRKGTVACLQADTCLGRGMVGPRTGTCLPGPEQSWTVPWTGSGPLRPESLGDRGDCRSSHLGSPRWISACRPLRCPNLCHRRPFGQCGGWQAGHSRRPPWSRGQTPTTLDRRIESHP